MRTLFLGSHWQPGNTGIQMAAAVLSMEMFGIENIEKWDNNICIHSSKNEILTEDNWNIIHPFLHCKTPQFMDGFHQKNVVVHGYFQNSVPLVKYRDKILHAFSTNTRLRFPMTKTNATIYDLMTTPCPISLNDSDVVIHLRLGDYRAAKLVIDPFSQIHILRDIRKKEPETRIIIVCEKPKTDAEKNYIRFFEEFHPVILSQTELEDFTVLRSAKRIIVTNSTFSWFAAYLGNASERWIPEPTFNQLSVISETDHIYVANHGFNLADLDIPSELLPVTGEYIQSLCEFTVLDFKKKELFHFWIDGAVPLERQLFIETEWNKKLIQETTSLFVYPEEGLLETVVARGPWPSLKLLVVHNGDNQIDYNVLFALFEQNPQVYAWIQNNTVTHPRIRSLPIAEQNRIWRGGTYTQDLTVKLSRNSDRPYGFLYPWCSETNPIRKIWSEEAMKLRVIQPNLEVYPKVPVDDYCEVLTESKAVICPPGNGFDTHRHWESLYKGAWAIVHDNQHTQCLLKEYPSLPFIKIQSPATDLPTLALPTEIPSPFHPMLLRPFWKTLVDSYTNQLPMHETQ